MIWKILSLKFHPESHPDKLAQLQQQIISQLPEIKQIIQQLAVAALVGFLFNWLNVPVGWLMGSMSVGIAYAVMGGSCKPLPIGFTIIGQGIIAITTATRFSLDTLMMAKIYALPLLVYILITGSLSIFNGYVLSRFSGLDMATSFLGCIPGVSASLVAMSEEIGADAIATAILQYIRLLLVALIVPTVASLFFGIDSTQIRTTSLPIDSNSSMPIVLNLLLLAGCAVLGSWVGKKIKLPMSMFLGPFFAGLIAVCFLPYPLQTPPPVLAVGLIFMGLYIGRKFDWQTVLKLQKAVLIEVVLVLFLILVCIGVGYEFHLLTQVDSVTGILGASPGGVSAVMASIIELGGDPGVVLAMQMTRMLTILLVSPWVASFLTKTQNIRSNEHYR